MGSQPIGGEQKNKGQIFWKVDLLKTIIKRLCSRNLQKSHYRSCPFGAEGKKKQRWVTEGMTSVETWVHHWLVVGPWTSLLPPLSIISFSLSKSPNISLLLSSQGQMPRVRIWVRGKGEWKQTPRFLHLNQYVNGGAINWRKRGMREAENWQRYF